jgi:hypothetical protein
MINAMTPSAIENDMKKSPSSKNAFGRMLRSTLRPRYRAVRFSIVDAERLDTGPLTGARV